MVCPACNTENRDGARFCKGCGGKLVPDVSAPPAPGDWATT
ncbi:MAG: zinc-ribbon domain-containing protein, partial [Comamonadaceae bacterium]